jgi:hypothetical protein
MRPIHRKSYSKSQPKVIFQGQEKILRYICDQVAKKKLLHFHLSVTGQIYTFLLQNWIELRKIMHSIFCNVTHIWMYGERIPWVMEIIGNGAVVGPKGPLNYSYQIFIQGFAAGRPQILKCIVHTYTHLLNQGSWNFQDERNNLASNSISRKICKRFENLRMQKTNL